MSIFEKAVNILMKLLGIVFLIDFIRIILGYYIPILWTTGLLYLLIAGFFLMMRYSRPKKTDKQ